MLERAALDELHHGLPLAVVALDQPVDQFVHMMLDRTAAVGQHPALELTPQPLAVHQLDDADDAQFLVEETVAPLCHLVEDVIDAVALVTKVSPHIGLVGRQLLVDDVQRPKVALEQSLALADHFLVVGDKRCGDADRV